MADVVQVPSRAICCCLVFLSLFLRDCLRFQEAIEAGAAGVSSTFAEIHQVSNHHLTSSSPHLVLVLILIILTQSSSSSPNPHPLTSSSHLIFSPKLHLILAGGAARRIQPRRELHEEHLHSDRRLSCCPVGPRD